MLQLGKTGCQLKGYAALSGLTIFVDLTQASASLLPGLSRVSLSGFSETFLLRMLLRPERLTSDSPGSSEAEAWEPFRLQRRARMLLRPERLTSDSPGSSEAEALVYIPSILSPERAAHPLISCPSYFIL